MSPIPNRTQLVLFTVVLLYLLSDIVLGGALPGSSLLRPIIGCVLLTVLPGYLLVVLFGIRHRPPRRIALYAVGLSLCVVAVTSIVLNGLLSPPRPAALPSEPDSCRVGARTRLGYGSLRCRDSPSIAVGIGVTVESGRIAVALTFSHYGISLLFTAFLGGALLVGYTLERVTTVDVDVWITTERKIPTERVSRRR